MPGLHVSLNGELYPHLALENLLLDSIAPPPPLLFLWRGPRAVVLGKNQNPWRECNLPVIQERRLRLARRVSGGGAVYHDPGNLNVAWVFDRKHYAPDLPAKLLSQVLGRFGAHAEPGSNGGLRVNGGKVSGAAFCYRQDRVLHHGTLLVDANLADLRAALSPPMIRMETHAVASVPAQVANLCGYCPGITVEAVAREIELVAKNALGGLPPLDLSVFQGDTLARETARMASNGWVWGQTPAFSGTVRMEACELRFSVRRGRVLEVVEVPAGRVMKTDVAFGLEFARWCADREGIPVEAVVRDFAAAGWTWPQENNSP